MARPPEGRDQIPISGLKGACCQSEKFIFEGVRNELFL
jgi:hypothetical protein